MTEIIFGPPGTGKTTSLLECVDEELARGTPPDRIGYISFTRRAAEEAVTRACAKFKLERDRFPYFRTLHSLCYRGLGLRDCDVLTGSKLQEFADYAKVKITGKWSNDGTFSGQADGDRCLRFDNMSRVRRVPLREEYNRDPYADINFVVVQHVSKALRAFKNAHGLLDYTDFLEEFIRSNLSTPDQLEVLIVDEAQDLSSLQWKVVDHLSRGCRRVIIAADDDQAIYDWAGADVECLLRLDGERRVLHQSWRVPRAIQGIALGLVSRIHRRQPKEWKPRSAEGSVEKTFDFMSKIDFSSEAMILVRNDYLLRQVHASLRQRGIVYEHHGHSSINSKHLEAAESWEDLRRGKSVTIEQARKVYGLMSIGRGVKHGYKGLRGREGDELVTLQQLQSAGGLLLSEDPPWYDALDRLAEEERRYMRRAREHGVKFHEKPSIRIGTIHTSKGAEAKHVILLLEVARRSDRESEINPDSELRVWYVAVTRAKEKLTLVPSPFSNLGCRWL